MGLRAEDADFLYNTLFAVEKNRYEQGNYHLNVLNIHGQHCQIDYAAKGMRDHENELFNCYMGCVI